MECSAHITPEYPGAASRSGFGQVLENSGWKNKKLNKHPKFLKKYEKILPGHHHCHHLQQSHIEDPIESTGLDRSCGDRRARSQRSGRGKRRTSKCHSRKCAWAMRKTNGFDVGPSCCVRIFNPHRRFSLENLSSTKKTTLYPTFVLVQKTASERDTK